ncbi:putative disease resistance protein At3g14460 [Rosa chinensis]|nr:putative disease resistance protein At3g14460 [Rosa chinensis]XP_040368234.1 putative disease resistance protein At3g14460 [Rosa chinensis]XP_040368237.1 putative disease resistance protein At3g14460 [Rosa chinensis]
MGDAVLGAFIKVLLQKLAHQDVLNYFGRLKDINRKKLDRWTVSLIKIEEVLNDAEEKQLTQPGVKLWLDALKDLAYDMEDILDEFSTKMLRLQIKKLYGNTTSKLWRPVSKGKFNFNMNTQIKKMNDRVQEIYQRENHLGLNKTRSSSTKERKTPPSSCQLAGPMIGREEDKKKIVEFLSEEEPCNAINVHVVAIVGMPGIGKTTVAGDVFNDAATEQFYPKGWISVSHDFNIVRLTKAILEYVTSQQCQLEEFSKLQEELKEKLRGKKFLIVLDDVWIKDGYDLHDLWTRLQSPFTVGAPGSKILVTTRDINVAKIMAASEVQSLECISDNHCLDIFEEHALRNKTNSIRPPNFELLKTKIAAKCSGLPLAARTLGGILCHESQDKWEDMLDDRLWSLFTQKESHILLVLKMSYYYLPSRLKRCFAYCSVLPHDYEFGEAQLILLWMAEDLIQPQPKENKQMEDLGRDIFQELLSRSLFQKSSRDKSKYVMHDLVTDMARWAAGEICLKLDDKSEENCMLRCSPKARHSSYICGEYDGVEKFEAISELIQLRTFLPLSLSDASRWNYLTRTVTFELLPKLRFLRVLSLNGYKITELPDSIGKLKHLRYLDLSYTLIAYLPESTSTLCNLQTLILESCYELKALPTNMRNLINLRHLNNSGVCNLKEMPSQLGQLTNLRTLRNFAVGKGSGARVREIGSLLHLQGTLRLSRLENVIGGDARDANLKSKERLEALLLEWSSSSVSTEITTVVLDMLQPHRKLKALTISGYAGLKFPTWIGDHSFSNMVRVSLTGCNHCQFLPPFGQLSSLKELHIQRMDAVESVGPEFYGEGNLPFQALETLKFQSLKNWKEWSPCQQDLEIGFFCCLKMLSIEDCPKLEGRLPEKLDSLAKLDISGCEELVVFLANYKQLHESDIQNCKLVVHTSLDHFDLLESLWLSNISEFRFQRQEVMKRFKKVKELKITGCEELAPLSFQNDDRILQCLISLRHLYIQDNSSLVEKLGKEAGQLQVLDCKLEYLTLSNCGSLLKVPEGFHHLMSLQELYVYDCSSLVCFPDLGLPPSLKVIEIRRCKSLMYLARGYQVLASLRRIEISDCSNLKSLIEKEEEVLVDGSSSSSCLESLEIMECRSLTCLSFQGQLSTTLKHLKIVNCTQLELITDGVFHNTSPLEKIHIQECPNLTSLPEGLCYLTSLESILIRGCEKLEVVPILRDVQNNLDSVEYLWIDYCEGLSSFPLNLTSLTILNIKSCKALLKSQGLHRLTCLRHLWITGKDDPNLVSFPPTENEKENENEMLLPKSLLKLYISGFPNLKKLSKGFQFLTSLQILDIFDCPKLAFIPDEGLPRSLGKLVISYCPILEKKCKEGSEGRYWPKIAHIPCILIAPDLI